MADNRNVNLSCCQTQMTDLGLMYDRYHQFNGMTDIISLMVYVQKFF